MKILLLLALLLLPIGQLHATQEIDSVYGPLPVFELHSGFWVNLHHTLYYQARQRSVSPESPLVGEKGSGPVLQRAPGLIAALTPGEQRAWDDAVSFYAANYASKDLQFSTELAVLKNQLGEFDSCDELTGKKKKTCDAGLPGKIGQVLESVASVYRSHWWAGHDRVNRLWVARVAPLVREQGVGLSERLAGIYRTHWPKEKIRVDVSFYANAAGAYTTLEPLRVTIASGDARNQGPAALEVLFHEASHGIAQPVEAAILRECHQRDKAIPRDLWHALIFYTTGEVIRPVMSGDSPDDTNYVPYAVRQDLYKRGWEDYLKLLTKFWQPYLDNKSTFDDSIARMVSAL
ncbi:MAG: hypothetical protein NVS9B13_03580 [Candidatus Acidiferrum sp.]